MKWATTYALALIVGLPSIGAAQSGKIFCVPGTQACFSAAYGFVSSPPGAFYPNRVVTHLTNYQGVYGGLDAPFGILGMYFSSRLNPFLGPQGTLGWFGVPVGFGKVIENPQQTQGLDFDQPTGGSGFMRMLGVGYLGCDRDPQNQSWSFRMCARNGRDGGIMMTLDLASYRDDGTLGAATFDDFALSVITTHGTCVASPSPWYSQRDPAAFCDPYGGAAAAITASANPEPATILLLSTGLAGVGAIARRRRRAARPTALP